MSTDNFGALGADFFIKTFNKGSSMNQADLDNQGYTSGKP